MKSFAILFSITLASFGCTSENADPDPGQDSGGAGTSGTGTGGTGTGGSGTGSGSGSETFQDCLSDSCVCPTSSSCEHACDPGGPPCHVQCATFQDCDVMCESSEECHVEALTSATVTVDCAGASECHVTCPASGCTVENCVGSGCVVSCGVGADATLIGTTATCP